MKHRKKRNQQIGSVDDTTGRSSVSRRSPPCPEANRRWQPLDEHGGTAAAPRREPFSVPDETAEPAKARPNPITMHNAERTSCAVARQQREYGQPRLPRHRGDDVTALVPAAARGEQRAWRLLVRRFSATIRAEARRHRLNEADQEDVAQRTWLRLLEHIESVREPAALGGWLATTARRECIRVLAASRREILVDERPIGEKSDPAAVEDAVAESERRAALHGALDGLPARQRKLMRMLLSNPALSFDEVSAALGMPRGSLGPTHGRCLARLRRDPHLARVVGASLPVATSRRARVIGHDLG